ncbi:MAG TPA: mandelate racemase/muconate lactonizing enzyme family protein [bacterium]|nr:mandelate racemase/muconate lactonizing enzyme family protein [bacterium]
MRVTDIETLSCDAGWRNYHFVKLTTDAGIVGWSEFDEWYGSPGVTTVIEHLAGRVKGQPVMAHERIHAELYAATRMANRGVVGEGIGAIENALLDAKAKALQVPCYQLLGGKLRDRVRLYWSHCATWHILHPRFYPPAITNLEGTEATAEQVRARRFTALKTNMFIYEQGSVRGWHPGFAHPFVPELTVDKTVRRNLRAHLEALRSGAGPDIEILLDLNFNAKTAGYLEILSDVADLDLSWVEIDTYSPKALAYIRARSAHPVASCETLFGLRDFLPYFHEHAMDIAIVDAVWNGAWQTMKISAAAEAYETNVALHNFYGHLSTMINGHIGAAIPNLHILEYDGDRLSWDAELFTHVPEIDDGHLIVPDRPGWGTEPNEDAIRRRPPQARSGTMTIST